MQPEYHQITTRKGANHVLHLLLTLLTCGLWAPVWFIMAMVGKKEVATMQGFTASPQQPHPPQQPYGQTPQQWQQPQPPAALPPAPNYPPQQPGTTTWGQKNQQDEQGQDRSDNP